MDTTRFDLLASLLSADGTGTTSRRHALRTLAGLAAGLATAGLLSADEGEARKKRKKKNKNKSKNKQKKGGQNRNSNGSGNGNGGNGGGNNTGGGNASEEETLLGLINAFRAQNNQPALARNGKLDTAALNHSQDMANRNYFSHTSPEGGTPDQRILAAGYTYSWWGENIYQSAPNDASAQSAFNSWVNSSGHRANMLNSNFTQIGIGRATAANGRTYWTNTFGKPA